jgi:hypothetical protein
MLRCAGLLLVLLVVVANASAGATCQQNITVDPLNQARSTISISPPHTHTHSLARSLNHTL